MLSQAFPVGPSRHASLEESSSFPHPIFRAFTAKVCADPDPRFPSFVTRRPNCMESVFRVMITILENGHCMAHVPDTGDNGIGWGEQGALHQLIPLLVDRFSDARECERFQPCLLGTENAVQNEMMRSAAAFYSKLIHLTLSFSSIGKVSFENDEEKEEKKNEERSSPPSPLPPKNIYSPPPCTPRVLLRVPDSLIPHMGKKIGKDGCHFIHWTREFQLEYMWFHREIRTIEIFGLDLSPSKIAMIQKALFRPL